MIIRNLIKMVLKRVFVSLTLTLVLTHTELARARRPIRSQEYEEEDIDDVDDYEDSGEYQ